MAIEIVVAEHTICVAAKRFTQVRHGFKAGPAMAVGATAIVTRQHTKVIVESGCEFGDPMHGGATHVRVQIAKM